MRVHLSQIESTDTSLKSIYDISCFNNSVLDGEAKLIVVNNFLCSFNISEIRQAIELIIKKIRIGGELVIIEQDIDLLAMKYFRDEISIEYFNTLLFKIPQMSVKSILTSQFIKTFISASSLKIEEESFDENLCSYTIKARK